MGTALYIALEREIAGLDVDMDGKALSKSADHLETLAKTLGIRPLMDFFSLDPDSAAEFLDEEVSLPAQAWFPATEGLRTVRSLISHLGSNPTQLPKANQVIDDLREMERILNQAALEDVGWCLQVDY